MSKLSENFPALTAAIAAAPAEVQGKLTAAADSELAKIASIGVVLANKALFGGAAFALFVTGFVLGLWVH